MLPTRLQGRLTVTSNPHRTHPPTPTAFQAGFCAMCTTSRCRKCRNRSSIESSARLPRFSKPNTFDRWFHQHAYKAWTSMTIIPTRGRITILGHHMTFFWSYGLLTGKTSSCVCLCGCCSIQLDNYGFHKGRTYSSIAQPLQRGPLL